MGFLKAALFLRSALLEMYVRCGSPARAQPVFDDLKVRDVVLSTSLMTAYCEHGEIGKAIECLEKMQMENLSPDVVSFTCMLKASALGLLKEAKRYMPKSSQRVS